MDGKDTIRDADTSAQQEIKYQKNFREGLLPEQTSCHGGSLHLDNQYDTLFSIIDTAS